MTLSAPLVITVGGLYLALLFLVAFLTDRLAEQGRARFLASPIVYTLSLAVYCTSWTFFGAVGTASRSGIEFVTIYIGPLEFVDGGHSPFFEVEQVVAILVELAEAIGPAGEHFGPRDPPVAIAVVAEEAPLFARQLGRFWRCRATHIGGVGLG